MQRQPSSVEATYDFTGAVLWAGSPSTHHGYGTFVVDGETIHLKSKMP